MRVIDFYCGAGGFSEGFRQAGFEIIQGFDHWKPAIDTFNHNFGLNCSIKNMLEFENTFENIEKLPDTEVIIGSPPCVSFSSSNKSGKADKSMGIRLTEVFLKIVAIKKYKPGSILQAWYMENVSSSKNYLAKEYRFQDLGLSIWAKKNGLNPKKVAIKIEGNSALINSADYGSAQARIRVISGEIISKGKLLIPAKTFRSPDEPGTLPVYKTLGDIKKSFPATNSGRSNQIIKDPLYPEIKIKQSEITDHFYDSGLYKSEWKNSQFLKVNHPYMGIMSFPENESKPSRTITATKIGSSRESIIYKSEFNRKGNGEYRTPTVREAATLMSFPITYQFIGSHVAKWRLVGNAVCPSVSRAFAINLKEELGIPVSELSVQQSCNLKDVPNLNTYSPKLFNSPPKRVKGSRFRRHPFKDGNITVSLSNYNIERNQKGAGRWQTSIQYGNGKGTPMHSFPDNFYKKIEPLIQQFERGGEFVQIVNNGFSEKIATGKLMQKMYELQQNFDNYYEPTLLVEKVAEIINKFNFINPYYKQEEGKVFLKNVVPKKQILALYAINKIASIANNKSK